MINNVVLLGRLTAAPELKTTQTGISVTRFTVAVERDFKTNGERQTDFISCIAWRQTAEFITRYFTKGQMIAVQGSLQTGSYTDRDGRKVYTTDVIVDKASFAGGKADNVSPDVNHEQKTAPARYESGSAEDFVNAPADDDLPF